MPLAAIGIGSNLCDARKNVRSGIRHLGEFGDVRAVSRLYRTAPWGIRDQPEFCNAVALLETPLAPRDLLQALKALETQMGRTPGERWGPRFIDFDLLLYDDEAIDESDLRVPHPRLYERAFVLAPLADVDARFADAFAGLPASERESVAPMSEDGLSERVRTLAQAFLDTDLMRLRIEDDNDDAVELRRKAVAAPRLAPPQEPPDEAPERAVPADRIRADLVGVFHFSRPRAREGDAVQGDRELGYVEALGIRNPVRTLGSGRIEAVRCDEGEAVEYGQVLFEIARV